MKRNTKEWKEKGLNFSKARSVSGAGLPIPCVFTFQGLFLRRRLALRFTVLRIPGSGRFTGRGTRNSIIFPPGNTVIKAIRRGIKPQLYINSNLIILTLRNSLLKFSLRIQKKATSKSFIMNGLKKPGLKS